MIKTCHYHKVQLYLTPLHTKYKCTFTPLHKVQLYLTPSKKYNKLALYNITQCNCTLNTTIKCSCTFTLALYDTVLGRVSCSEMHQSSNGDAQGMQISLQHARRRATLLLHTSRVVFVVVRCDWLTRRVKCCCFCRRRL